MWSLVQKININDTHTITTNTAHLSTQIYVWYSFKFEKKKYFYEYSDGRNDPLDVGLMWLKVEDKIFSCVHNQCEDHLCCGRFSLIHCIINISSLNLVSDRPCHRFIVSSSAQPPRFNRDEYVITNFILELHF